MNAYLGYQPAVAAGFNEVVAAMNATHDALIARAGRRRASGITWEIFGSELAGVIARRRGGRHGQRVGDRLVSGTIEEGFTHLRSLIEPAADRRDHHPDLEALDQMREYAAGFPTPTLIIAYCQIRPTPTRAGRPASRGAAA